MPPRDALDRSLRLVPLAREVFASVIRQLCLMAFPAACFSPALVAWLDCSFAIFLCQLSSVGYAAAPEVTS